jgi:gas vesicle protein
MHSMEENENREESEAGTAVPTDEAPDVLTTAETTGEACRRGPGFLLGGLMGALVGAALATIFAPVSGQQARVLTAEKAPELWRRRDELAREGHERALGVIGGARARLGEALEAAREETQEAQREARRRYEQMTGRRSGPPLP